MSSDLGHPDQGCPARTLPCQQDITERAPITDLLSHRTGLESSNAFWYGFDGELLTHKHETLNWFNNLRSVYPFRSRYIYSNVSYNIAGLVIEKLSGLDYGNFLRTKIFEPLGLTRTSTDLDFDNDSNRAFPYAVLSDHTPFQMPNPKSRNGTLRGAAQGIQSSTNDLLKYGRALLHAYTSQLQDSTTSTPGSPLKHVVTQFSTKIACGWPSMFEKSSALGIHRIQLPNQLDNFQGCQPRFASRMPVITPGPEAETRLMLGNLGSQAGYTSLFVLLPEMDTCFAVQVNSIGLSDPANWIVHLLLETLVDTPASLRHDYVLLAKEAAFNHANVFNKVRLEVEREFTGEPSL